MPLRHLKCDALMIGLASARAGGYSSAPYLKFSVQCFNLSAPTVALPLSARGRIVEDLSCAAIHAKPFVSPGDKFVAAC
ncbi:MAG: hypothetical protein K8T25_22895, partial [Planctomycetia bacterium]|nr:hypothetical protein [Planctomycetia bacterium]